MKVDVVFAWLSKERIQDLYHVAKTRFPDLDDIPISLSTSAFCIPQVTHKEKWKMSWVFFVPAIFILWTIWFSSLFTLLRDVYAEWPIIGVPIAVLPIVVPMTISAFHDFVAKNIYTLHFPRLYLFQGKSPLFVMCHEFAHILLEENPKVTVTLKQGERSANLIASEKMRELKQ
jgi:hypothetical protein